MQSHHRTPLVRWSLHKYKCLWGGGQRPVFKSPGGLFTNIDTQIRLEQNSILYQKNTCIPAVSYPSFSGLFGSLRFGFGFEPKSNQILISQNSWISNTHTHAWCNLEISHALCSFSLSASFSLCLSSQLQLTSSSSISLCGFYLIFFFVRLFGFHQICLWVLFDLFVHIVSWYFQ